MNQSKIYIDSNFFVSLHKVEDINHLKALNYSKVIKNLNAKIVISNLIFLETITVLSQRVGRKEAVEFGQSLLSDTQIELIYVSEKLNYKAWSIFQEVDRKNVSFVDCSSVVVMKEYDISQILTFDETDFNYLAKKYRFKLFK